jgi:hypothetical protein
VLLPLLLLSRLRIRHGEPVLAWQALLPALCLAVLPLLLLLLLLTLLLALLLLLPGL